LAGSDTGFFIRMIFMSRAFELLFSFCCTVYPERSEGHSCTA